MIRLTDNNAGQDIETTVGETLELDLTENPTTGYRWHVVSDGKPACEVVDDRFEAGQGTGRGGQRIWRFRAVKAGTCEIEMAYRRAWEADAPARTFKVRVRVQ